MSKTSPILIALAAFAAATGARGAVLDRVCTISSHAPSSFAVQIDTTRHAVLQNNVPLADGSRSASLPSLGYFVTSDAGGTMA